MPFLLPACTIAFLISKWRVEKTRTVTFPSIFTCPRYVRASWPVPLKNDIYISPPIPAESLCSMHIHPGHETGFSLAPRKLPRQKAGQNFFPLMKERSSPLLCSDARPVYAIFLPLDSKLPHLPRPRSSFDRFIGFSLLSIYIYVLYIYYIPVMKISCDVSGDAAVSSRTGMITGANTVGLPPLTRGCGGDREKRGRSRGKERKGGKERHLSISFNPTFPCRLLLSIYYKLFCRSPRGAACPTDGENTRAFHSIKFDKVRRRCTEGGEGYPREFPVIAKSKMARVRARYRARYRWHACRYYHSRDGDSFRDLSIECIEFPCSILNSVNALVRFVPRKFATSLDTNILSRRIIVAIIVAIVHWYLSLIFKFVRVVYWLIRVLSFEKYLKIDFASVSFKYFGWEFVFLKSLSLRSFLIITLPINNIRFYRIKILDSYKLYDKIQSCASFINIYK